MKGARYDARAVDARCMAYAAMTLLALAWARPHLSRPALNNRATHVSFSSLNNPSLRRLSRAPRMAADADDELNAYWQKHETKWRRPLRLLDVFSAWNIGELDGVLPSGNPSRTAQSERMLTLSRAIELFDEGKLDVRSRYRSLSVDELKPRWARIVETRSKLQAIKLGHGRRGVGQGARVREGARRGRGRVGGRVACRLTLCGDAALARAQSGRGAARPADGGIRKEYAKLQQSAGADAAERWLTAALLAELESEASKLEPAPAKADASPSKSTCDFNAREAERDLEQANFGGLLGVGLALVAGVLFLVDWEAVLNGGGEFYWQPADTRSGLDKALDLMQ